jgi:hypothetical protein
MGHLFALLPLLALDQSTCAGEAVKEKFLRDYAPHAEKLETFYGKVTMRIAREAQRRPKETLLFKANHPSYLLEITREDGSSVLRTVNNEGSFGLRRAAGHEKWYTREVNPDYRDGIEAIRLYGVAPFAAYCVYETSLQELTKSSDFKLKAIKKGNRGKEPVVIVEYKYQNSAASSVMLSQPAWAVLEHTMGSGRERRIDVRYEGESNGIPLVKEVQYISEQVAGSPIVLEKYTVLEIKPENIPQTEFRPDAFEPASPTVAAIFRIILLVLVNIVVLMVIGWLAWRTMRKTKQLPPSEPSQ